MSENDLEIPGEQSHTVEVTGNRNSRGDVSEGTNTSAKKDKIMMTEREQTFVKMFQSVVSNENCNHIDRAIGSR